MTSKLAQRNLCVYVAGERGGGQSGQWIQNTWVSMSIGSITDSEDFREQMKVLRPRRKMTQPGSCRECQQRFASGSLALFFPLGNSFLQVSLFYFLASA